MKLERVVVGIDFSIPSTEAAQWVARHLAPGAELILTHSISVPEPPPIVRNRFPRRDLLIDTIREGADKRLREISLSLGASRVWLEIREGNAVECLAAVAGQYQFEQTFLLPVAAMHDPARSPLQILERIKGRRLA